MASRSHCIPPTVPSPLSAPESALQLNQPVELLATSEAAAFYTRRCDELGQNCNPTFLKQLMSGTVIFEFDNGYLGNHGIVPIMETLQRVPLQELLLPKCALTTSDFTILCDAFATHPTLQRIDLRGNTVEVTSAKKILMLIGRNSVVAEIDLDESTPKYAAIQQQLARNRQRPLAMDKCLVCEKAARHSAESSTERKVLAAIIDLYSPVQYAISAVEFEVLFRLLQRCCERGRGLLYLCSGVCVDALANMLYASARCVLKACHFRVDYTLPTLQFLHAHTQRLITEVAARHLDAAQFEAPCAATAGANVKRGGAGDTHEAESNVTAYLDSATKHRNEEFCTVCGKEATTLSVGPSLLMEHLAKDVRGGAPLGASALLRLVRVFAEQSQMRPCSRKCSKHVQRYALFGFGGAVRRQPTGSVPLLSTVGLTMESSTSDFSVIDFEQEVVDTVEDEETVCARCVASAVGDVDNIRVDPYSIFAVSRKLRKQAASNFGSELQAACEAVCLIGCVEDQETSFASVGQDGSQASSRVGPSALDAPSTVCPESRPPRSAYSSWDAWAARAEAHGGPGTVAAWLRNAFSHRRNGFYQVDGPHRHNLFDNVRCALWTFRRQRRSVLTVMKFTVDWLTLKDGVVPDTSPPKGGFYTCVKVVGQCLVDNEFRLVIQGFFGPAAGRCGYFYFSKYMFNISAKEGAYIFVDGAALYATEAAGVSLADAYATASEPPGSRVASSDAVKAVTAARDGERAVVRLVCALTDPSRLSVSELASLRPLLSTLPLSAAAFTDPHSAQAALDSSALYGALRHGLAHRLLPSQLLFTLSEQLGADGVAWVLQHFLSESSPSSLCRAIHPMAALEHLAARHADGSSNSSSVQSPLPPLGWQTVKAVVPNAEIDGDRAGAAQSVLTGGVRPAPPTAPRSGRKTKRRSLTSPTTARKRDASTGNAFNPQGLKSQARISSADSRLTSPSSDRDDGGLRGAAKESGVGDPRQQALAQHWAIERLQAQPHLQLPARGLLQPRAAQGVAAGTHTSSGENLVEHAHWHQRWTAMRLCKPVPISSTSGRGDGEKEAVFTSLDLFIIGDTFTVYDLTTCRAVSEGARLADHPLMRAFPFPAGCDALVHHPLRPREVFVFAAGFWALWDACEQVVISGPFELGRHAQFRRLPPDFLGGIDGAVPAFGTPFVLLFRQAHFVLFDVEESCCASEVRHLNAAPPEPPLRAATSTAKADRRTDLATDAAAKLPVLVLENKLCEALGTAPLAALPEATSDHAVTTTAQVLTASGKLLSIAFRAAPTSSQNSTSQPPVRPVLSDPTSSLCDSAYRGLPLRFQQSTTHGAWAVCESLVGDTLAARDDVGDITFFDPRPLLRDLAERERTLRADRGRGSVPLPSDVLDDFVGAQDAHTRPSVTTNLAVGAVFNAVAESDVPLLRLFEPLCEPSGSTNQTADRLPNALLAEEAILLGSVDSKTSAAAGNLATPNLADTDPACVDLHLGSLHEEAFGGVMLVLDTSSLGVDVLRLAPITAVVESSLEDAGGQIYQRRGLLAASAPVSVTTWSECHVARHWRLRFLAPLPAGLGIVRVLWLRTQWRALESPVRLLQRVHVDSDSVCVRVDAARVLADCPEQLLSQDGETGGASVGVFEVCGGAWYARHAVLPLVAPSSLSSSTPTSPWTRSCLVFCGERFAEVNLVTGNVAGRRSCRLRTHPAFSDLPAPFNSGLDAVIYPPRDVCGDVVVLISRGWQIHWNLRTGRPEGQKVRSAEGYFKGLPVDLSQVDSICNSWEAEAEESRGPRAHSAGVRSRSVWIIFRIQVHGITETRVLQWSLVHQLVEKGPCAVQDWLALRHSGLTDAPIECFFNTPDGATHVFSQGEYHLCGEKQEAASATTVVPQARGHQGPLRQHLLWHRLGWYLPDFATPKYGASVTIDMQGRTYAVLGIMLTSAHADNRDWQIAYSDDCVSWNTLPATHCQTDTTVETTWWPTDIAHQSHRFWRLSTGDSAVDLATQSPSGRPCVYSGLSLLVLPSTSRFVIPERVSVSGTSLVPIETLFQDPTTIPKIAFEAGSEVASLVPGAYRVAFPGLPSRVHHVTVDYGYATPALLTGFSCHVSAHNGSGALTWTVLCADDDRDPGSWHVCAVVRCAQPDMHVEWIASQPQRFWRIEVIGDAVSQGVLVGRWELQRYAGPIVTPQLAPLHAARSLPRGADRDKTCWCGEPPFSLLMAPVTGSLSSAKAALSISSQPGAALEVDMRTCVVPVALVGVDVVCTSPTCQHVVLQLQQSDDGHIWMQVAQAQWFRGGSGNGLASTQCRATGSVDTACFWRLVVLSSDNACGTLAFHCVRLVTAKANLYENFLSPSDDVLKTANGAGGPGIFASSPAAGDVVAPVDASTLTLRTPRAMCQVCAMLPPCSVYQVERLSLDGITWEGVALLDNSSVAYGKRVRRGWSSLVPSTVWRLRSLTPVVSGGSVILGSSPSAAAHGGGQFLTGDVCWSSFASVQPTRVNMRYVPGLIMCASGFTEVEPIRELCPGECDGAASLQRPRAVLRYPTATSPHLAPPADPSIVWHFAAPTALHQVVLIVHVTWASADTEDLTRSTPTVVVENSANGVDYVSVAEVPLLPIAFTAEGSRAAQKHLHPVSLSWDRSGASCAALEQLFWCARFTQLPASCTLDVVRAEWFTLQGAAVTASAADGPRGTVATTNTAFAQWKHEGFNREAVFCQQCHLGLDEARSLDSKLRDAADYTRAGATAALVLAKSKRFHKFIVKLAKNTSPSIAQMPDSPLMSSGTERFRDIQYFLTQCGRAYPDARFDELVPLVGQPLPLRDLVYSKKSSLWFYPRFEVHGSVTEPFYGIPRTQASFSVLWSLSFDLQRHNDLCDHPEVGDVSPHVASPLVVVNITQKDWQASKSFPGLPLLYHVGFTACPMTVVFALNEVTFTDKYKLPTPDGTSPPVAFPFSVFPGVNFLRYMPIAACPAPVFDPLRHLFSQTVLENDQTIVVFTVPTLQSRTATVRFTLPASGLTLGLPGLSMDALHFEFTLTSVPPEDSPFTAKNLATFRSPLSPHYDSGSLSASLTGSEGAATLPAVLTAPHADTGSVSVGSSTGLPLKRQRHRKTLGKSSVSPFSDTKCRIQMISRNAVYHVGEASSGGTIGSDGHHVPGEGGLPVSVLAELRAHGGGTATTQAPQIDLACASQSGCLPVTVLGRRGAVLADIAFSSTVAIDRLRGPRSFITPPTMTVQATLALPFGAAYTCHVGVVSSEALSPLAEPDEIQVRMADVSLTDLLAFLRWLFVEGRSSTAQFASAEETWIRTLPLTVSLELSLQRRTRQLHGSGSLSFGGSARAHNVTFTATAGGWHMACSMPKLSIGELVLQQRLSGGAACEPVRCALSGSYESGSSDAGCRDAVHVRLTAHGDVALLGAGSRSKMRVEASHRGTFATAQTPSFDLTVEDLSLHARLAGALQVCLREEVFLPMIRQALESQPLVTSLLAAGLHMRLTPDTLYVKSREPTPARRLTVCFCGVLFGSWFDVVVSVDQLYALPDANRPLCEALAAEVVEQCASSLWASYGNLVGRAVHSSCDAEGDGRPVDVDPSVTAPLTRRHADKVDQGTFLSLWANKECDDMDSAL